MYTPFGLLAVLLGGSLQLLPQPPLRSFGFLPPEVAEGHVEQQGHGDGKPQVIKGLVLLGPMGTARAFWWAA